MRNESVVVVESRNQYDTVSISRTIAKECGVCAAFVFEDVSRWIRSNECRGRNIHDGRVWMYDTLKQITADIGLFSLRTVQTALSILVEKGFLVKGNYNDKGYDRTVWYSLGKRALGEKELIKQNLPHPDGKDCHMRSMAKFATPIPIDNNDNVKYNNIKTNGGGDLSVQPSSCQHEWPTTEEFLDWLQEFGDSHCIGDYARNVVRADFEKKHSSHGVDVDTWKPYYSTVLLRIQNQADAPKKGKKTSSRKSAGVVPDGLHPDTETPF